VLNFVTQSDPVSVISSNWFATWQQNYLKETITFNTHATTL